MGGQGSGHWYRWDAKTTVEDCRVLSASRWMRECILRTGVHHQGSCAWFSAYTGERTSSLGYEVKTTSDGAPWVRLRYAVPSLDEALDYRVHLQTTTPHFGGIRWWFTCPLTTRGRPCRRRCEKLYVPPGGKYYGCRECYDLSYASRREDRAYRMVRKANKIRFDKLGGGDEPTDFAPLKPKGMHWATYERLCREEQTLRDGSTSVFLADRGLPPDFPF